jgi:hypothetical protein
MQTIDQQIEMLRNKRVFTSLSILIFLAMIASLSTFVKGEGASVDVYTQYPDGHNDKGPNQPSDSFGPRANVTLYANVTYNSWPEQNKDVTFQIADPHGNIVGILYNRTNEMGIAYVRFQLPQLPDDPSYYLGTWEVTAGVNVAGSTVCDNSIFEVKVLGDVNNDGCVDTLDVVLVSTAYGSRSGDINWNPEADIATPYGIIDIFDLVTAVVHYGETC